MFSTDDSLLELEKEELWLVDENVPVGLFFTDDSDDVLDEVHDILQD
ncbi:hypothetical protein FUAX_16750 [Fulvitalea axinellae]|uniref:Uncharacterized protein n=1 Tax=Fulvitalea axinellae TaxID=1182444 RepID=A0AAU9CML0_9BACT|nr:hypothetical protein FUAX_16750 [Fulvitalea axinellae]